MSSMTEDLITWLRAQLDDDERANAAPRVMWAVVFSNYEPPEVDSLHNDRADAVRRAEELDEMWRVEEWGPAPGDGARRDRDLAEVDAKRQRIEWLAGLEHDMDPEPFVTYDSCRSLAKRGELGDLDVGYCSCGLDAMRNMLFRFEALPYADREGYRPEWRPE